MMDSIAAVKTTQPPEVAILIVEDEAAHAELLRRAFAARGQGFRPEFTSSLSEARRFLKDRNPSLVIADLVLPDGHGTELLETGEVSCPLLVMTSHGNEQMAVEAMKLGALDYLVKSPAMLSDIPHTVERALREWKHLEEEKRAREEQQRMVMRTRRQNDVLLRLAIDPNLAAGRLGPAARSIAAESAEAIDVERVALCRLAEDGSFVSLDEYTRSSGRHDSGNPMPKARSLGFSRTLESGRVVAVHDTGEDPRTQKLYEQFWRPHNVAACLSAPVRVQGRVIGVVCLDHVGAPREWTTDEITFSSQLADLAAQAFLSADLRDKNKELSEAYDTTLEGWSRALELRDKETVGHTRRVTDLTVRLAEEMGVPRREWVHIFRGALLHDIGKMAIPDRVLQKPGPLTDEEIIIMQRHPEYAREFLAGIPFLQPALDIPYCHHEKWDGSGYPRGLAGEEIPLSSRLFSVIDVWDALSSDRPYRSAWATERVREYISAESGSHFDPAAADAFLHMTKDQGPGLDEPTR